MGLTVEKNNTEKYRLSTQLSLLNKKNIIQEINQDLMDSLYLQTEFITNSTNDSVTKTAQSQKKNIIYISTAEYQTHARGRYGKEWFNPFGATISLSFFWKPIKKQYNQEGLSLAVGMAVIKSLNTPSKERLTLKWPNDIFYKDKKLGGILIESSEHPHGNIQVTIGIGVNVNLTETQIKKIPQPSTDMTRVFKQTATRNLLIAQIINSLIPTLKVYEQLGFSAFHREWCQYDNLLGRNVTLKYGNKQYSGVAQGVNESGQLIVKTASQTYHFNSGEVSLQQI